MKILRKLLVFIAILILTFSCSKVDESIQPINEQSAAAWSLSGNIGSGYDNHDPCLIKENSTGTWWVFTTGTGLPIKYSSYGLNWTQGWPRFNSELSWWRTYAPKMGSNNVWAPMCYYYGGRYWLYYCVSEFGTKKSAIGLTSCSGISKGDWRDDGLVLSSDQNSIYNAIDPDICADASGNLWMSFGSWNNGINLVKLNTSTMKPTGTIYNIANYNGEVIEGPSIMYNGGYYYLFASYGACCNGVNSTYRIGYGRAKSITGPYYNQAGVAMLNGAYTLFDVGVSPMLHPGGQSVYKNGSNYIMTRHAYDANNNGVPTLLINDLYFSGGWPTYLVNSVTGVKQLRNRTTGLYLDGMGRTNNGGAAGQWANTTSANARWIITTAGSNYYYLINQKTNLELDGMGRTNNGADAGQWPNTSNPNSQWSIISAGSGYYYLKNRGTGLYLDGMGRTNNGDAVGQWANTTSTNAQWQIVN